MTGYTVHTGSTEKFSEGWDRIFESKKTGRKKATATKAKPAKKKKPAAKKGKK